MSNWIETVEQLYTRVNSRSIEMWKTNTIPIPKNSINTMNISSLTKMDFPQFYKKHIWNYITYDLLFLQRGRCKRKSRTIDIKCKQRATSLFLTQCLVLTWFFLNSLLFLTQNLVEKVLVSVTSFGDIGGVMFKRLLRSIAWLSVLFGINSNTIGAVN